MITIGSFVRFVWLTSYKAPSLSVDDNGHVTWHELHPGDTGIVLEMCKKEKEYAIVLFSNVDALLRVHMSMLQLVY